MDAQPQAFPSVNSELGSGGIAHTACVSRTEESLVLQLWPQVTFQETLRSITHSSGRQHWCWQSVQLTVPEIESRHPWGKINMPSACTWNCAAERGTPPLYAPVVWGKPWLIYWCSLCKSGGNWFKVIWVWQAERVQKYSFCECSLRTCDQRNGGSSLSNWIWDWENKQGRAKKLHVWGPSASQSKFL